ncbi:unnamed protein product [Paramecium octaurelia]|uniref:TLDc domain-containing protein n=1 Tax=Paramecium octaurelia TaxID=43137 RepID=A0A8S1VSZ5_PAROT|nr:unnamed protein product [Paramecium octaurelia]
MKSTLIYQGTRDGFNGQSFWKASYNKESLLTIIQSKSEYIFGAYSLCKWVPGQGQTADPTYASFLFSQTHNLVYPQKSCASAIYCSFSNGPAFGGGPDIWNVEILLMTFLDQVTPISLINIKVEKTILIRQDKFSQKQRNANFMKYNLFEIDS